MPDIKRKCYALAFGESRDSAEITMYGDIVETKPVDWWTGEECAGDFIVQSEFLEDLNAAAGCKKLTIRMNSLGGDAGVSILIHNRLRELAENGTELNCIVDGAAMSGGSLIMCACDNITVNPSSLIMIHKCWTSLFGAYNADELRQIAKSNDAYDKAQASIYCRKTGLSETVISHMMADTTYMTGKEAVEKGFADSLAENAEPLSIAASADRRSLVICGRTVHLPKGMTAPEGIPTVTSPTGVADTDKGGNDLMAKNLEELRKENSELAASVEQEIRAECKAEQEAAAKEAAKAERDRLAEIDSVAAQFDGNIVHEAKYGNNPCSAQEMCFRAAQEATKKGASVFAGMQVDFANSGAAQVAAVPQELEAGNAIKTPAEMLAEARRNVQGLFGKEEK